MNDARKGIKTADGIIQVSTEVSDSSPSKLNVNKNAIKPLDGFGQVRAAITALIEGSNNNLVYSNCSVLSSKLVSLRTIYYELGLDLFNLDTQDTHHAGCDIEELKVYNPNLNMCVTYPVIDDDKTSYDKYNILNSLWTNHVGMDCAHITAYREASGINSAEDMSTSYIQCSVGDLVSIELSPGHRGKAIVIEVLKRSGSLRKNILSFAPSSSPALVYFDTNSYTMDSLGVKDPGPDILFRESEVSEKKLAKAKEQYKKLSDSEFVYKNLDGTGQDGMLIDGSIVAKHEAFYISLYLMLQHMIDYTKFGPPAGTTPRILNYGARMVNNAIDHDDEILMKIVENLKSKDIKDFDGLLMAEKIRAEQFSVDSKGYPYGASASGLIKKLVSVPTQKQIAAKHKGASTSNMGYHNPQKWSEGIAIDISFATFGCPGLSNSNCSINEFITKFAWQYGFGREYASAQGYAHLVYYGTSFSMAGPSLFRVKKNVYKGATRGSHGLSGGRLWAPLVDNINWVRDAKLEFEKYYLY